MFTSSIFHMMLLLSFCSKVRTEKEEVQKASKEDVEKRRGNKTRRKYVEKKTRKKDEEK